jgi:ribosomal-protein-alanine N-acetyltransferase
MVRNVDALHAELRARNYPHLKPGIEPGPAGGREMQLIDPASNRVRFFEPASG